MYIPVQICAYVLKHKLVNEFRLYLYLKYYSKNGNIKLSKSEKVKISKKLNCCERTITNTIKKLLALFWISKDNNEFYYIRGYECLIRTLGKNSFIYYNTRVEFSYSYFDTFRAYLAGAIFGYFLLMQKNKLWKEGRKKIRSYQPFPNYLPLALNALVSITKIKKSTLQNLRILAVKHSFLNFESGLIPSKSILVSQLGMYKKGLPENANKIRVINGEVFVQTPNRYKTLLRYKKGRKKAVP